MLRIAGFDGIRGLSVISVVFTHLHVYGALHGAGLLPWRVVPMVHGTTGVQAFFILSGFLITHLLVKEFEEKNSISLTNFYIRRTIRIFPIYFLLLIFVTIMAFWIETGVNETSLIYAFFYSYNFIPKEYYSPLIGHTWSLAVEEHFYLLWPIIFVLCKNPRHLTLILISAIAGSHFLMDFLAANASLSQKYFIDRWTFVSGGNIAIGCLGALLLTNGPRRYRDLLGSRATLAVAFALFASSLVPQLPDQHLRPFGIGLVIAWVYLNQKSRLTRFLEVKPLAYLGVISYGIYIYQGFFLSTGPARFPGQEWPPHPLIGLILLCLVAPLSFRYLERPLARFRSKFSATGAILPTRRSAGSGVVLIGPPSQPGS